VSVTSVRIYLNRDPEKRSIHENGKQRAVPGGYIGRTHTAEKVRVQIISSEADIAAIAAPTMYYERRVTIVNRASEITAIDTQLSSLFYVDIRNI
jgi:hypothetical protein